MSSDVVDTPLQPPAPPPGSGPTGPAPTPRAGTWRLSWHGVRTVAVLELRQRVRSTRWVIVLGVWFVVLGGLTTLVRFAVHRTMDPETMGGTGVVDGAAVAEQLEAASQAAGAMMFGIILFLVLGLAGLVAPALTATSINGDRNAGVLATLQTTLLSPAEIAVGKLLAAWTTALALLAAALPFIGWAYVEGGTSAGRLLVTVALLAVMLLVVCAVALGWSAIAARTSTSAVLTYLSVALLGLGLPLLFGLAIPLVTTEEPVKVYQAEPVGSTLPEQDEPATFVCRLQTQQQQRAHTERVWWLLAANPFVVLADAAPRPAARHGYGGDDPLTAIRGWVREVRLGPPGVEDWCTGSVHSPGDPATGTEMPGSVTVPPEVAQARADRDAAGEGLGSVWPFGLTADLLLGVGFVVLAIRRLRTPTRVLPRGTRVA